MFCLPYVAVFSCLVIALGATIETKSCSLNPSVSFSTVKFYIHTRLNPDPELITNDVMSNVIGGRKTIVIIHGWKENSFYEWVSEMKNEYLELGDFNVFTVDWGEYSICDYISAQNSVPEVGRITGDFICTLVESNKLYLNDTQLNGFSLGAHIAGYAGQQVQLNIVGQKIARINGLEAASPGFVGAPPNKRLDNTDASFVQGFHTSNLGMNNVYGVVDVYFNSNLLQCGTQQPGCPGYSGVPGYTTFLLPISGCSHVRSIAYFTSTINNPSANLIAVKCNCISFSWGFCQGTKSAWASTYHLQLHQVNIS
ncbi:hypothetical protein FQA39_LY15820 [Lamprigera yunnana]|nr:hypothetical protein FQA39_LY15820 [Lamprigera yunnana]